MTQKLKVGIAGFGMIGPVHALHILSKSNDLAQLVAIAEPQKDSLDSKLEKTLGELKLKNNSDINQAVNYLRHNLRIYGDYKEMLEKEHLDVLHICLPHDMHYGAVENGVKKGKSVIVEKPLAMDQYEAAKLIHFSEYSDAVLGFISQNRYNSEIFWLRYQIENFGPVIGVDLKVDWFRDQKYYDENCGWRGKNKSAFGGVLTNQGYHQLDLALWLMNFRYDTNITIEEKGNTIDKKLHPNIEVPDKVKGKIIFPQGIGFINYYITTCNREKTDLTKFKVHLEKDRYIELINNNGNIMINHNFLDKSCIRNLIEKLKEEKQENKTSLGRPSYGYGHGDNIRDIYLSILNKQIQPIVSPSDALNVLRVTDKILEPSNYN